MYKTIHAGLAGRIATQLFVAAVCAAIALLAGALALESAQPAAAHTTPDCEVIDLGTLSSEGGLEASGSWTTEDCDSRFRIDSDAHTYRFQVTAPGRVRIELTSPDGDPYLYLLTEGETRIADDDEGGAILDARIERDLTPGVYLVEATPAGGRARGSAEFTLSIQYLDGCEPVDLGALEPGVGLTASGSWTLDTCGSRIVAAHPAHNYTFTLPRDGRVVIDLTSPNGDPVLSLASLERGVIGANDDGGGDYNSRIESYLTAGVYLVEATTYRERGLQPLSSDFDLVVRLLDEETAQRRFNLKVEAIETPDQVIAGEPFAIDYRVGNLGLGDLPADGSYALAYATGPRRVLDAGGRIPGSPERWQAGVSYHSDAATASATSVAIAELASFELTIDEPGLAWVFVGVVALNADDEEIGFHGIWRNLTVLSSPTFGPVTVSADGADYTVVAEADDEGLVTISVASVADPDAEVDPSHEVKAIYVAGVQTRLLEGIFERPVIAALGEQLPPSVTSISVVTRPSSITVLDELRQLYTRTVVTSGIDAYAAAGNLITPARVEDLTLVVAERTASQFHAISNGWRALLKRLASGQSLTLEDAIAVHFRLHFAEAVATPFVNAGRVVRAAQTSEAGWADPAVRAMLGGLAAEGSCDGAPTLGDALQAAGPDIAAALLALDLELRGVLPVHGLATNAALCAIASIDARNTAFARQLTIDGSELHDLLVSPPPPPPPPAPEAEPEPLRLRIIVRLAEDGRLEHGVELANGRTLWPENRFLGVDAEIDRWHASLDVEVDGAAIGQIRARRLADGRVELGFRDSGGNAIEPATRYVPAELRPGVWLRSSRIEAPPAAEATE